MKTLKLMAAGCIAALTMLGADATGKWTAQAPGRDGNPMTMTINLKADGNALSGSVSTPRGDAPISEGKVDGNNVTFDVVREFNGNKFVTHYVGVMEGDTIHLTVTGGRGGERKLDAKRSAT